MSAANLEMALTLERVTKDRDAARAEVAALRAALACCKECCDPPGIPNLEALRIIIDAALAAQEGDRG